MKKKFYGNITIALVSYYPFLFPYRVLTMDKQYCNLNLTLYYIYCCLITGISNVTAADTIMNLTKLLRETKETKQETINTIMFGMIGLAVVSFIIYLIYIYTVALKKTYCIHSSYLAKMTQTVHFKKIYYYIYRVRFPLYLAESYS